jgi:cyclopropane fatty-acyl-phospholipid synthase-like methyltransferase
MRVQTYIHLFELGNKQYNIQKSRSIEHAYDMTYDLYSQWLEREKKKGPAVAKATVETYYV